MPLTLTDTPTRPIEKCALDIVRPLIVTTNGNKYILTYQDNLTKFNKVQQDSPREPRSADSILAEIKKRPRSRKSCYKNRV